MTKNFVKRIIESRYNGYSAYERAGYTYQYNENDGCIRRIRTDDIGKMWIDHEGNRYDAWGIYLTAKQVEKIMKEGC